MRMGVVKKPDLGSESPKIKKRAKGKVVVVTERGAVCELKVEK